MSKDILNAAQIEAVKNMKNGCILCGGVGSGKSRTALAYYYLKFGGELNKLNKKVRLKDLYIITIPKKRDNLEWEGELALFLLSSKQELNIQSNKIFIDSWNNIKKYENVSDCFFIFDEHKISGYGEWSKTFIKIAKKNEWILLSATPGDKWLDYMPVFIANGFYKNKKQFETDHVVYDWRVNFPRVNRYLNTGRLIRLKKNILVNIDVERETIQHHEYVLVDYPAILYKDVQKNRKNPKTNKPIKNASEYCYLLREIVNTDESRLESVIDCLKESSSALIFYNFDYELDLLKICLKENKYRYSEWNGHRHGEIPTGERWAYLVQYNACEGWNCITTNTVIFYSQTYSYKTMVQAAGRIDRMNTPFKDLYYYHLYSNSKIDLAIRLALKEKKKFNEMKFFNK